MILDNKLPPHAHVWVFAADRNLTTEEIAKATEQLHRFIESWTAHKVKVVADGALVYSRFVVLMADEAKVGVSGCSIDSSVHFIKALGSELGVDFFNRLQVVYRQAGEIKGCSLAAFSTIFNAGEIGPDVRVFDTLVSTKEALDNSFEKAIHESPVQCMLSVSAPVFSL